MCGGEGDARDKSRDLFGPKEETKPRTGQPTHELIDLRGGSTLGKTFQPISPPKTSSSPIPPPTGLGSHRDLVKRGLNKNTWK